MLNLPILIIIVFLLQKILLSQTLYPEINQEIQAGNFSRAQKLIQNRLSEEELSKKQKYDLNFQTSILDRIRLDFNRNEAFVRKALSRYYPDLSEQQLRAWEASNDLKMKVIDGQKRYFRNAVPNLFRVNEEAKKRKIAIDGIRKSRLDSFLASYLPAVIKTTKSLGKKRVFPVKFRLQYTLSVKPNTVPDGEIVRAWLPYPRSDRERLVGVRLVSTSEDNYLISPGEYTHQTIYMEKRAQKEKPTIFKLVVDYKAYNEWHDINAAEVNPYDKNSQIYQIYTAERENHILFTPQIKALSKEIVGIEKDPLVITRLIYQWIGENIPWASALEYSTIPNIPMYCINNMSGDCGIKSLLFITLCRHNGIPAKWQSGWYLYPVGINLHDWSEVYFEGFGWIPVDPDFNDQQIDEKNAREFFFSGADAYRLIVNDDFSGDFFPAKIHLRSETVDFQRGEVEWRGGNLYFNQWDYHMEVEYLEN
jgi:transglutaminase-like putative cysteine protease